MDSSPVDSPPPTLPPGAPSSSAGSSAAPAAEGQEGEAGVQSSGPAPVHVQSGGAQRPVGVQGGGAQRPVLDVQSGGGQRPVLDVQSGGGQRPVGVLGGGAPPPPKIGPPTPDRLATTEVTETFLKGLLADEEARAALQNILTPAEVDAIGRPSQEGGANPGCPRVRPSPQVPNSGAAAPYARPARPSVAASVEAAADAGLVAGMRVAHACAPVHVAPGGVHVAPSCVQEAPA